MTTYQSVLREFGNLFLRSASVFTNQRSVLQCQDLVYLCGDFRQTLAVAPADLGCGPPMELDLQ